MLVDSYFWRRWLWPEFDVLFFNTLQRDASGRMFQASSAWGTEPFGWYFTRALPKALLASLAMVPLALVARVPRVWAELSTDPWAAFRIDWRVVQLVSMRTFQAACVRWLWCRD